MRLHEVLLEYKVNPNDVVRMPRRKMAGARGIAPTNPLSTKQQAQRDNMPEYPAHSREGMAQRAKQQQQAKAEQKKQVRNNRQVQQAAGVPEITAANAMDKIPELMQKHAGDQDFIKAIVSTVATAVSSGADRWKDAQRQMMDQKNRQKNGIRGRGTKQTEKEKANKLLIHLSNLSPETKKEIEPAINQALRSSGTRQRATEAVQPQQPQQAQQSQQPAQAQAKVQPAPAAAPAIPAGGINKQAQQVILAQIKAAVQGMNKEQRKVLKARVQQAALLKGQKADPKDHMQKGQPVVNRAGIERTGPSGFSDVKSKVKNFFKTDVRDFVK